MFDVLFIAPSVLSCVIFLELAKDSISISEIDGILLKAK
jgi:hypothetical protein